MTKIFTPFCRSRRADSKYIYFVGSHKVFFYYNYIIGGKIPRLSGTYICKCHVTGRKAKSLFLILGRSSVLEVPACLRDAMMYMFCLRAHRFTCTGTLTTEDWPSIRNKLFDVLPM